MYVILAHALHVMNWMSFREVVRKIGRPWLPFHDILLLVDPVSDPVESQVHCLGLFLVDGSICDANSHKVVPNKLSSRLRLTKVT